MADTTTKEQKQPQQGSKKKGSYAAYKAAGRLESNKRRSAARDARRQARDASKRPRRVYLRKLGAVTRLQRRLDATTAPRDRERVAHYLSIVVKAAEIAYADYEKAVA